MTECRAQLQVIKQSFSFHYKLNFELKYKELKTYLELLLQLLQLEV